MVLDIAWSVQVETQFATRWPVISKRWYQELLTTGFPLQPPATVRQRLTALARHSLNLLLAEPLDRRSAQKIGAALVEIGFHEPAALGLTQQVLGRELIADLPIESSLVAVPQLVIFLGELATGFTGQMQATLLATQQRARHAAEVSLQVEQERLHLVVEHIPIILFAFDRAAVITFAEGRGLVRLA